MLHIIFTLVMMMMMKMVIFSCPGSLIPFLVGVLTESLSNKLKRQEFNIVMSRQFRTLAMFHYSLSYPLSRNSKLGDGNCY